MNACVLKAAEILSPRSDRLLPTLARNTVMDRIADLSEGLDSQKMYNFKSFVVFPVAIDESIDISDAAHIHLWC